MSFITITNIEIDINCQNMWYFNVPFQNILQNIWKFFELLFMFCAVCQVFPY